MIRHRIAALVLLLTLALVAVVTAGAETPPLSEEAFFNEVPVVLSVTRLVQPKSETPAAVTVIDREMIEASGARQIADLFRLVPGFQVGYVNGHQPTVTNHGMSDQYSRRMQVLIDGRSVYSPFFGTVFWSELPLAMEDIERIEVVRGPNAASYGANAVLGVINIITRHPSQDAGGFEKLSAGNHGILDGVVRRGWSGTDHSTRVTVGYRADDGFDTSPDSSRVPYLSLRSDRHLTTSDNLEFQFGASKANSEEGFFTVPTSGPRDTTTITHFELLRWSRRLDSDQELSMQFFHNYRNHDEDFLTDPVDLGPLGIARVPVSFDAFEERYDLELQHTLRASPNWRIVWGAGARLDRVRSQTWFNTSDTLENRVQRLFGNTEWRATKQAIVNAGVMVEKTSLTDTDISPRLALNYHLADEHTLRAAVSRASRTPFLLEVKGDEAFFFNGVLVEQDLIGARDLKPEKMDSFEVGYLGRMLAGRLLADVRLYRDRLRDIITPVDAPSSALQGGGTSFQNEGQVTVEGVDTQIDWRPDNDTRLALSYAYMRPSGSEVGVRTSLNQQARVTSVPHHTLGALVTHRLSNTWQASALYYRVAEMLWLGDGDVTGRYGRLDLRLGRRLKFDGTRGELAVTIQNALNDKYVDFRQENIADRRAFITFSLSR